MSDLAVSFHKVSTLNKIPNPITDHTPPISAIILKRHLRSEIACGEVFKDLPRKRDCNKNTTIRFDCFGGRDNLNKKREVQSKARVG